METKETAQHIFTNKESLQQHNKSEIIHFSQNRDFYCLKQDLKCLLKQAKGTLIQLNK